MIETGNPEVMLSSNFLTNPKCQVSPLDFPSCPDVYFQISLFCTVLNIWFHLPPCPFSAAVIQSFW